MPSKRAALSAERRAEGGTAAGLGTPAQVALLGVDFTCAPSARKPIVVARGGWVGPHAPQVVQLLQLQRLHTLAAFEAVVAVDALLPARQR